MSSGITIMASIYDGHQRVGYVLHHLDESVFEAIDVEKRSYGTYATHQEAAAALPSIEKKNDDQSI
jgi:hypothetical protein